MLDNPRWEIFTHGGRKPTGIDAIEWAKKMADYGAGEILLNCIDRDGTNAGYDIDLGVSAQMSWRQEKRRDAFIVRYSPSAAFRARFPEGNWAHLSMGMTDDYEVAIEEGATMIRVGRAIFGPRD